MNDAKYNALNNPCSYFILWDNDDNVLDCEYIFIPPSEIEDIGKNWIESEFLDVKWQCFIADHLKSDLSRNGKYHGFSRYDFFDSSFLPSKKGMYLSKYIQDILIHFCDNRDYECCYSSDYDEEKIGIFKGGPDLEDATLADYANATKFLIAAKDSFSKSEKVAHYLIFQPSEELKDEDREKILIRLEQTSYYQHSPQKDLILGWKINYLTPYIVLREILNRSVVSDSLKQLYTIQSNDVEDMMGLIHDFIWKHSKDNYFLEVLITILLNNKIKVPQCIKINHLLENTSYPQHVKNEKKCCPYHLFCVAEILELIKNLEIISSPNISDFINESMIFLLKMSQLDLQNIKSEFIKNNDYGMYIEYIENLNYEYIREEDDLEGISEKELADQTKYQDLSPLVFSINNHKSLMSDTKAYLDIWASYPENIFISALDLPNDKKEIIEIVKKIENIGPYYAGFKTSVVLKDMTLKSVDDFIKYYLELSQHTDSLCIALKQQLNTDVRIDILTYNATIADGELEPQSCILNEIYGYRSLQKLTFDYGWHYAELPEKKVKNITENLNLFLSNPKNQNTEQSVSNTKCLKI